MNITTTRFGEIEVNDDAIFTFLMPMIGYEEEDKFVILPVFLSMLPGNYDDNFRSLRICFRHVIRIVRLLPADRRTWDCAGI